MSDKRELQPSDIMTIWNNPTEQVNAEYVDTVNAYMDNPVPACSKAQAMKLLKRMCRKSFPEFWGESVEEYLPAVSEGTMKLAEKVYPHDDAIRYAKSLISALDPDDLARAFLYGLSHNTPEYRTALACYYYIYHLPEHEFGKEYVGATIEGDVYCDHICEICHYCSQLSKEPKMNFFHINADMGLFYHQGHVPFSFGLNKAILFLEEFKTLPAPVSTRKDLEFFNQIIALIEDLPANTPPSKLRKELKQSGLLKMTIDQIDAFIDMLGYLNILHTDDSFGVTVGHTNRRDMLFPLSDRTYFATPFIDGRENAELIIR